MAPFFHRAGWLVALLLFLFSCHDAPRNNPFDPTLTPPVELQVALDDTAGTATLTWSRYEGQQPFREYRVLRKVPGLEAVDTLEHLAAVEQTTFVDTALVIGTDYEYWVSVVNAGGFAAPSDKQRARSLKLPAVQLLEPVFDSRTASASLRWAQYAGPRFKAYRVERRTEELAPQLVKEVADLGDTSLVDSGLEGNLEYFYRVVVLTQREEETASEERSGRFHPLVATWPLEERFLTRLYAEGDQIAALMTRSPVSGATLFSFDREGQLLEQSRIGVNSAASSGGKGAAMAQNPGGQRFYSVAFGTSRFILSLGENEKPEPLFVEAFPAPLAGPQAKVLPEIALVGYGVFDNVSVSAGERRLFAEDFSAFPWPDNIELPSPIQGWEFTGGYWILSETLYSEGGRSGGLFRRRGDETWQDFGLEAEVMSFGAGIQVGGDTFSRFTLTLDGDKQQAALEWVFTPPAELGLEPQEKRFFLPFPITPGLAYHLGLEVVDGQVRAWVKDPVLWSREVVTQGPPWSSLATIENTLALTCYDQAYSITQEGGEVTPLSPFASGVSELRVWEGRRSGSTQVGVCLPEENQLLIGTVPSGAAATWSDFLVNPIGPKLGPQKGFLFYPISFDVGPDGRIYVLDAGNARIAVFDSARRFVTEWGGQGDGPGEFNFGEGARRSSGELDFAGSIAVDDQGYIYVCDEINRRIQKFAP